MIYKLQVYDDRLERLGEGASVSHQTDQEYYTVEHLPNVQMIVKIILTISTIHVHSNFPGTW